MTFTATTYEQQFYEEHRDAGMDYASHGMWQQMYGEWLVDAYDLRGKTVLDLGCACGSIASGIKAAGAGRVIGFDISQYMIGLGKAKFPEVEFIHGDADRLGDSIRDGSVDFVLCNQVLEHIAPRNVPPVLREIRHVLSMTGRLLAFVPVAGEPGSTDDPTHQTLWPIDEWCRVARVHACFQHARQDLRRPRIPGSDKWSGFIAFNHRCPDCKSLVRQEH